MAKPDYAFWDAQPDYTLPQTLALCCDQEPPLVELGPKHEAILWRLVNDLPAFDPVIQRGFLDEARPKEVHISREALRQWAEGTGQRELMPFLFPEDRESLETEPSPMRVDTREAHLLVIGLLSHALAEKGGPDFKTAKGPKQAGIIRELRKVAEQLGVPLEGLSDTVLNERLRDALSEVNSRKPAPRQ